MITSRLTALAFATLLSSTAFAATSTSDTGPTAPVYSHKSPMTQSSPGLNINGTGVDSGLPPSYGHRPADSRQRRGPSRRNEHARYPDAR